MRVCVYVAEVRARGARRERGEERATARPSPISFWAGRPCLAPALSLSAAATTGSAPTKTTRVLAGVWCVERRKGGQPPQTNTLTPSPLRTLGDVMAQRLDRSNRQAAGKPTFSGRHVAASAAYGATVVGECKEREEKGACFSTTSLRALTSLPLPPSLGPIGHAWYKWLDAFTSSRLTRGTLAFVAAKVFLDEVVFGPVHVAGYFGAVTLAEGGTLTDAVDKIKADFVSAYSAELAFWPAFQAINFCKVPVRHQLLAVNAACLLDATFLCWVSANDDWMGVAKEKLGCK